MKSYGTCENLTGENQYYCSRYDTCIVNKICTLLVVMVSQMCEALSLSQKLSIIEHLNASKPLYKVNTVHNEASQGEVLLYMIFTIV